MSTVLNRAVSPGRRRATPSPDQRLADHVHKIAAEHPPLDLAAVDYTVRRPGLMVDRFASVLSYMARAELEVERNALELAVILPKAPDLDRYFFTDVWRPQEAHHGLVLDELQVRLGLPPADTDLTTVSPKMRVLGAVAHLSPVQDVIRMLYYLTGMTTERSALLAYHKLYDGIVELGETAIAETVITPIRRQEPGHYAYYQMASRQLWDQLADWQKWLVRHLRAISFAPVGANSDDQKADVGDMMIALGIDTTQKSDEFTQQVARVEADLLGARQQGMTVPEHITGAFRDCLERAVAREAAA